MGTVVTKDVPMDGYALFFEAGLESCRMFFAMQFHHNLDLDLVNTGMHEGSLVVNVLNTPSVATNDGRELGDTTGPVRNGGHEPAESAVCRQAPLNNTTQDSRVDISTAQWNHYCVMVCMYVCEINFECLF